ncbi:hypothetical protein L6452_06136 [Arctium lappa]|uniref:Uncharacterized protein n=1 Tax=Arctium lappa TaxID=4217 RepID=A0ACB9EI08_ARCLA|nr:hypothetical protein L6452_06136 [Arctium lappa]
MTKSVYCPLISIQKRKRKNANRSSHTELQRSNAANDDTRRYIPMEFPSFHHHHHHNRYVPPPPSKNFSDDNPNLYPHHNHLLPPLRLPPPPPPLSYHSLPPPPPPPPLPVPPPPSSYNPHQSHFTFLDAQNPSFLNHGRSSPPPPRFSNQSHRFDYRTDSWSDPHRILPERPHRNPILPDDRHHRLYSPNSPSENYYKPHISERVIPSSRYRDDTIIDGYASRDIVTQEQQVFRVSPNSDDHHGRNTGRYASARSVMDMDKATGSSSRNSEDFVEKYEPRYMTVLESEKTWDGDEDPRWVHAMKGKKNESGHGGNEGVSFVSARELSRDYEYESGKFNRLREGREEFRQVQKKSVLLRIGKPNNTYRNRSHDQHFSKAYLVESGNCNFRGKDKDRDHTGKDSSLYLDQRVEGGRERSPVELDVSFKPNGLVAKAVVTPSSPVFDNNYSQPRNRKIKRATEFDSPLTKFSERSTRSGSSSYGLECPSSSEKAPKQLRDKDSAYDGVRVGDFSSLPCSDAVNDSSRNGADGSLPGPVLDQGGGSGGSDGPLSFRLRKKRKRMNLGSHAFNFQLGEQEDKSIKGGNSKNSPSAHIRGAIPFPPLEELIASEVDESPQAMVSEKDGSEVENLSSLSDTSNPILHDTKSCGDDPTENNTLTAQKVSTINDGLEKDLNQQPSQYEVPLKLEDDAQKVSTDVKVSLGGIDISASSGHDQIEIQKWPTESYASFDDGNISYSLCNVSVKMPEMSTSADMNLLDPCSGKIITVHSENGDGQGFDDVSRKDEEFQLLEGTPKTDGCSLSSGTTSIPNVSFRTKVKEIIPERRIAGDDNKQTCFNETRDNAILSSVEGYIPVAKGNMEDSEIRFDLATLGEKHENVVAAILNAGAAPSSPLKEISSDKDGVSEKVKLISSPVQTPTTDNWEPSTDGTYLIPKDDLQPSLSILSACADGAGAFVTDSNDKSGESMPDMLTSIVTSQKASSSSGSHCLIGKSRNQVISNSSILKADGNICEKSVSKDGGSLNCHESLVENSRTSIKSSHLEVTGFLANTKTASSTYQGRVKVSSFNKKMQGSSLPMKKLSSVSAVPRVFAGRSSPVVTNFRINNPAKNIAKPRTWHRSTSSSASSMIKSSSISVPPPAKQIGVGQNSYIRSGNTLVRKGAPVTAVSSVSPASRSSYQLNPSVPIETKNSAGRGSKVHSTDSTLGGSSAPVVRSKTPPLSGGTKLPDCTTIHSRGLPTLPLEHLPMKGNCEDVEGHIAVQKVSEYPKLSKAPEDENGTSSNSESQKTLDEGAAGKKIQYVKRKSNQLVATSNSDQSIQALDKTQASSSDGYYKRRKNQLIRTWVGDDLVNTDVQKASKTNVKRQSGKGISKKYKHLRYPSVWTLGSQSLGKDGASLRQKLRPHIFPWKRSRYLGNVMNTSASIPSNSSSLSISSKLLLSRKREMIYTRSKHGFSLRMSKLLSVGGSSLKWSKSIERNSKRANEEATLAVAAAEKKRREQHGTVCATAETKSRNNMSRDRIFRIGLVRYKMDPSRRTLQRISDEEPSTSMLSKEEIRRSYVPKRLLIGHDEYVRIGNGNQLVRNPKRRARIFANEKVRWSLHTARSRLAKKKKYCQFFTRFGKCNKDDGKCPYIHDSSKILVCTKFLSGSCSNPDCKLTHKVIPERMQDCSYFLQGLCSNEHCPYRHVNVNSAASICEGFLKGYCADGNECRKKHTYACPVFEATGACSQGTKCKLHHPRNRNMGGLKRKQHSMEQHHQQKKNARGRYFGCIRGGEAITISHLIKDDDGIDDDDDDDDDDNDDDDLCQEGKFTEYISLDISNEEATTLASEPSDCGYDEITKPIGIMSKNLGVS